MERRASIEMRFYKTWLDRKRLVVALECLLQPAEVAKRIPAVDECAHRVRFECENGVAVLQGFLVAPEIEQRDRLVVVSRNVTRPQSDGLVVVHDRLSRPFQVPERFAQIVVDRG